MTKNPAPDDCCNEDSNDEHTLFREAVSDTRPLKTDTVEPFRTPVRPEARFRLEDEREVLQQSLEVDLQSVEELSGERLRYQSPAISKQVLRSLARGRYRIEAEIDLHGLVVAEAREALNQFLSRCTRDGIRTVRIVHGKGRGSGPRGPVLKNMVNKKLTLHAAVLGFVSAPVTNGGTGAVYVLLDS